MSRACACARACFPRCVPDATNTPRPRVACAAYTRRARLARELARPSRLSASARQPAPCRRSLQPPRARALLPLSARCPALRATWRALVRRRALPLRAAWRALVRRRALPLPLRAAWRALVRRRAAAARCAARCRPPARAAAARCAACCRPPARCQCRKRRRARRRERAAGGLPGLRAAPVYVAPVGRGRRRRATRPGGRGKERASRGRRGGAQGAAAPARCGAPCGSRAR